MLNLPKSALPQRVHEELIKKVYGETETIVMHNLRDATAIDAREERPAAKDITSSPKQEDAKPKRGRGRPKKGEEVSPKELTRIEKQSEMTLDEMLKDLPAKCNIGTKKNSKGHCRALDWLQITPGHR